MKKLNEELKPIISFIAAVILGCIVIPFGIIHNIIKPFVDAFKFKRLKPLNAV